MRIYFIIFIFVWLLMGCQTRALDLPTRTECITGVQLQLDGRTDSDVRDVHNAFKTASGRFSYLGLAGFSINSDRIYFQFRERCGDRDELAKEIVDSIGAGFKNFPKYQIIDDPIEPSDETIDLSGPEWSDR